MHKEAIINRNYHEAASGLKKSYFEPMPTRQWYDHIIQLSPHLQATYMLMNLNNQVSNGGIDQYFVNGYGQFAPETIAFLALVGAPHKAKALKKAFDLINTPKRTNESFRYMLISKSLEKFFDTSDLQIPLSKIDDEFDDNDEDIIDLLYAWLIKK